MRNRLWIATLLTLSAAAAEPASFKVVVNAANPASTISRAELSSMLMKKQARWANGTVVQPVDQAEQARVRESFTKAVHGKSVGAVRSYWQQQIFSGRNVPPLEVRNDAEVVAYVRSKPGAIGYVSEGAVLDGVKQLEVQ